MTRNWCINNRKKQTNKGIMCSTHKTTAHVRGPDSFMTSWSQNFDYSLLKSGNISFQGFQHFPQNKIGVSPPK